MRIDKKYHIIVEDETTLEKRINFSLRFPMLILLIIAFIVIAGALGMFIMATTPLKDYLPGYLKESERTATEEEHLRLDSLVHVYEVNEAYINGILSALKPQEESERDYDQRRGTPLNLDSLLPMSPEEKKFVEDIRERDKYNIGNSSQISTQTILFGNVNKSAVIKEATRGQLKAEFVLPIGAPVSTIAEGKVISVTPSPRNSGGYEIIIQHPKGFLSKTSRLKNIIVSPGDRVASGQIIATQQGGEGMKNHQITLELWHDGDPVVPSRYIGVGS
ncbi:MAG: M23 family metallopeptidase [Muribaculaceae bacterium]|nr:M23 family metallopeptidase [Muribaculaceae bacterium]